uniref:CAAX prenyl protease 2 n=2 Tax=Canis lupus familiaris TaxID=9615 RepID=A0A8P0PC80_CANLF
AQALGPKLGCPPGASTPAGRLLGPRAVCCSINQLCVRRICFSVGGEGGGWVPALPDDVTRASGRARVERRRDRVIGARRGSGRDGGAGRGWAAPAVGIAAGAATRVGGPGRSRPWAVLLGVSVLLSQPRLLLRGQPLRLEERAAQVRGLRARPEPAPPRGGAVGGAWANWGRGRAVQSLWAPRTYCSLRRDHPAVIKRRFTSVLVVSSLSPLCVLLWRELTGIQPGTSLLTLMGFRLEGIFPAALLPLLLTMILFLGPLMQLSMDCPCDLADGLKVVLAPRSWARCLTDMRWLRNQVIAPLTEELVFRACMLPMLAPCTGLGPAVFTCPLFFGVAHFHHIFEQLRFRQSSVGSIFLSAGHLIGPVLCHSFCNYMGFPAVCAALEHPQRRPLLAGYALGVGLFLLLLQPLTDPKLYGSLPLCVLLERAGDSEAPLCS